ncbi:MAG TPA: tetratricopeptide repeat protein [Candidatus Sulfobium mesophilum]|nr:tetratricopeptide repeat protein [Candidatus Sulfobium mesophilum]
MVTRKTIVLILAASLLSAPVISCKKAQEQPETKAAPAINPYSNESTFDEVQRKLKEKPDDVDLLYHLADLYDRNSQYKEAIETYKKVIKLKPDLGYAYLKMATAYDRINDPSEAVRTFQQATKYMPKNPTLYNNMGVAYGKLGKYGEEIESLKKAIKLRPNYSAARYNLGMTYLKMKNKKAATKEYEALKEFDEGAAANLLKEIERAS